MVMGRNVQNARRPLDGMTYWQRTFGCQMNENDAERVAGMLETAGALPVATIEEADIAVFITCCVREKAELRLMGQVASIKNVPNAHEAKRIIAVGGCIGQLRVPHCAKASRMSTSCSERITSDTSSI